MPKHILINRLCYIVGTINLVYLEVTYISEKFRIPFSYTELLFNTFNTSIWPGLNHLKDGAGYKYMWMYW